MAFSKQLFATLVVALMMASSIANAENIVNEHPPHEAVVGVPKEGVSGPPTNHSIPIETIPIDQIKKDEHPPPPPPPPSPLPTSPKPILVKKKEKRTPKQRRTMHYLIHSTLEGELEDLLGSAYDESMIFHEDVTEIQKCIGNQTMEVFYCCLDRMEEETKKFHKDHPHPSHEQMNGSTTETLQKETSEFDSMLDHTLHQCFTQDQRHHVKECFHDQEFKIVDENMDLIDEHFDNLYGEDEDELEEDFDELQELKELEQSENEKRLHHGSFDNRHNGHDEHVNHHPHHQRDLFKQQEDLKLNDKLNQLELIKSYLKPTKSTVIEDPHHPPSPESPSLQHLNKRRYGYGPEWQTLVGKRDVHPLP